MAFDLFSAIGRRMTAPRRYSRYFRLEFTGKTRMSDRRLPKYLFELVTMELILIIYLFVSEEVIEFNSSGFKNYFLIVLPFIFMVFFVLANMIASLFTRNYFLLDRILCSIIYILLFVTSIFCLYQFVYEFASAFNFAIMNDKGGFCQFNKDNEALVKLIFLALALIFSLRILVENFIFMNFKVRVLNTIATTSVTIIAFTLFAAGVLSPILAIC